MGIKEAISSEAMANSKETYLKNPNPPQHKDRRIMILGWNEGNIAAGIAKELGRLGYKLFCFTEEEVRAERAWRTIQSVRPDTLILANGYSHMDWIQSMAYQDMFRTINSNLMASIEATQDFINVTLDDPWRKHIVYIGSMAYRAVLNASSVYCAAKAGLAQFARCMAWELAPKNYDVFTVHPSNTEGTPMTEKTIQGIMRVRNVNRDSAEEYWGAVLPKERWLRPDDIGAAVAFLISGQATYLSGAQLEMAGGQR